MHQFIVFPDLLSAQFTVHATLFFVRLEIAEIPSHYGTSMALPFDNLSGIGTIICFLFGHARLIFLVGTLISSITRWLLPKQTHVRLGTCAVRNKSRDVTLRL